MKLFAILPLFLVALFAGACAQSPSDAPSSATSEAITRKTLDGAYMKIYGGRKSYFVFHTGTSGNTFFAEFEGNDGAMMRADGTFTYGHDKLGNFVELKRSAPAADDPPATPDGGPDPTDDASVPDPGDASVAPDAEPPADDAGTPADDAAVADDAGPATSGDPTASVYDRFHFVKTGIHGTILTRDSRDRTYQFSKVASYCGLRAAKDCTYQHNGKTCSTGWTCTQDHACGCAAK